MSENAKRAIENRDWERPTETPEWDKHLFTPERVEKWVRGDITLQQLNAIAGPEMLQVAVIGFSMYEQGRYDEAGTVFKGLCSLDPNEAYYRTVLGAVHLAQDDLDSAEACFNGAIHLDDKDLAAYVNRGEVHLRKGRVIDAANDLQKAVDLDPANKNPLSQRARFLAAAALETIERAKKLACAQSTGASVNRSARN
jgi:tetratricopeptide (TPR) repeat protein